MVKKVVERKYFNWKWLVAILVIGILVWAIWFFFFSYEDCGNDWDCFNANLEKCDRTKFIGGSEMIFEYSIHGKSGDSCSVGVELLQGELNNQDSEALEGYSMTCNLPYGVVMLPESNIGYCTGKLKEGLQDLIIQELHTILVENLGRLNLELVDIPGTTESEE